MIVDLDTGEVVYNQFAKFFPSGVEKLMGLTTGQMALTLLIVSSLKIGDNNEITITPKKKKDYMRKMGVTTSNSISNMLRTLCDKDIVKKDDEDYSVYMVNPSIFFRGDDFKYVDAIKKYNKDCANFKVFKNRKDFAEHLSAQN